MSEEKRILSKFEWFLLFVALAILGMVILQNQGIHPVETIERTEISEAEQQERLRETTTTDNFKDGDDRLNSLMDYFAENRAQAKSEGKTTKFSWSSLKIESDEEDYLKNKYGEPTGEAPSTDWLSAISKSYSTYKSVKSAFQELGIDTDKVINADNASKALDNPIIANSIYEKIEKDFGIPAEKSKAVADKNRQNLGKWAEFVERELDNN